MDFERELQRVADLYRNQGFQVIVRPGPEDLPPFAQDFKIEILGVRDPERVLVAVKKNRNEAAADPNLPRYAEITNAEPGWRFDLVILEAEDRAYREIGNAREFSAEDVDDAFDKAREVARLGFVPPALIMAWSGFEAAMRLSLCAAGESINWGTPPRSMLRELYSNGTLSVEEFRRLETLSRVRNQIAHGFISSPAADGGEVTFLCNLGERLVEEARGAAVPS
jgi:REase_AHJR-like